MFNCRCISVQNAIRGSVSGASWQGPASSCHSCRTQRRIGQGGCQQSYPWEAAARATSERREHRPLRTAADSTTSTPNSSPATIKDKVSWCCHLNTLRVSRPWADRTPPPRILQPPAAQELFMWQLNSSFIWSSFFKLACVKPLDGLVLTGLNYIYFLQTIL